MKTKELNALISLLDDPDESVYGLVRERIVSLGAEIIPNLENIWELQTFGNAHRSRIEDLIHVIQFGVVRDALEAWSKAGAEDLFEGALLIARYQYPDMDVEESHGIINRLRRDIWLELNEELTAFEKINILFEVNGYRGNRKNHYAAQNSFLNRVLESKKGNALSLGIIYLLLAKRLGVPIYGVDLPHHFILTYQDENHTLDFLDLEGGSPKAANSLFYINAFNGGTIMHANEIRSFLKQLEIEEDPMYYTPCDNRTIALRLLENLVLAYDRLGYPEKSGELKLLKEAVARHGSPNGSDTQP